MQKMLRTIRFDETDPRVFERAAAPGEWAVPGSFAFADLPRDALTGKTKQAYANGFLGLSSFGWSTFVTVGEITETELADIVTDLADHFSDEYAAPTHDAALEAAREEIGYAQGLCHGKPINTVFTLRRVMTDSGDTREEFRIVSPPTGEEAHARIWSIEREDGDGA